MGTALCRVPPEVCAAIYAIANIVYSLVQYMDSSNLLISGKQNRRGGDVEAIHLQWKCQKTIYERIGAEAPLLSTFCTGLLFSIPSGYSNLHHCVS